MAMILGAIGAVASTFAAVSQLQYQAAIAKANAKQERINAENARIQADQDVLDLSEEAKAERGQLRSSQSGSGFNIGSASFGLAEVGFGERVTQDQFRTKLAGNQRSTYYENRASIEDTRAAAARSAIGPTIVGGLVNVASNFVGGASANARSPGFLPLPRRRNRIVSPSYGLA